MINITFKCMNGKAIKPYKAHETDAGFDLYSTEEIIIYPRQQCKIGTGVAVQGSFINKEDEDKFILKFQVEGTSGNASKLGLFPIGGVVDQGYTGEIVVVLCNHTADPIRVPKGGKIAQLVPEVIPKVKYVNFLGEKDEFKPTDRGTNGFGSTGTAIS